MAARLARSLAASSPSWPSRISIVNRISDFASYSSSSSWWSSPEDLTAGSKRREKKTTDRFSAAIDAVHDRKLPPELRGHRNFSLIVFLLPRVLCHVIQSLPLFPVSEFLQVNFSLSDDESDEVWWHTLLSLRPMLKQASLRSLSRGLAADGKTLKDAKKYLFTYAAVFEGFVREEKEEAARELLKGMKGKVVVVNGTPGYVVAESSVMDDMTFSCERKLKSETDIINVVEQRIWHSMEEGQFENLPGKGKPLNLHTNPHADPAEDTLYRILNKNGFAPEWVELNKDIRSKAKEWRVSLKKAWAMKLEDDQSGWEERSDLLKTQLKQINNMASV
ncbi:hypothetical protein Bca101_000138 [Brassica carinata]